MWRGTRSIVPSHEWTADQKVFWSKSKRINRREARKRFFRTKQFPGNAKRSISTSIPLITLQQWPTSDHYQIWSFDKVVSAWSLSVPNHLISWLVSDQRPLLPSLIIWQLVTWWSVSLSSLIILQFVSVWSVSLKSLKRGQNLIRPGPHLMLALMKSDHNGSTLEVCAYD